MADEIYVIGRDGKLEELRAEAYDSEALLQRLLADYPNLLGGNQIDASAPRRWLLVKREMGVPGSEDGAGRWSVDHLFLDQDGVPTLVEVKRSADTRIRREVVGQMLDYAANAVLYWPVEAIQSQFVARCERTAVSPDETLEEFLAGEGDASAFWERVKTNLQAGKVRMLFVADLVPPELKRIVEFLNTQMDPAEVLALEIKQYAGAGMRTLVPRILGQTAEAQRKKVATRSGRQWDEESFFAKLAERGNSAETEAARELLLWASRRLTRVWWGRGRLYGSFVGVLQQKDLDYPLFAAYASGQVEVYFQWLKDKPAFAEEAPRRELLARLNAIPGIRLPEDAIGRRPSLPLSVLGIDGRMQGFSRVLEWVVQRIEHYAD